LPAPAGSTLGRTHPHENGYTVSWLPPLPGDHQQLTAAQQQALLCHLMTLIDVATPEIRDEWILIFNEQAWPSYRAQRQ
jgi:hypothetical protein